MWQPALLYGSVFDSDNTHDGNTTSNAKRVNNKSNAEDNNNEYNNSNNNNEAEEVRSSPVDLHWGRTSEQREGRRSRNVNCY